MHIEFDLNRNDLEALLHHCDAYKPSTGDAREDARLTDALETLKEALQIADTSPTRLPDA